MNCIHACGRELQFLGRLPDADGPDSLDPLLEVLVGEFDDLRVDAVVGVPLSTPVLVVHELVHRLSRDEGRAVLGSFDDLCYKRLQVTSVGTHGFWDSVDGFLMARTKDDRRSSIGNKL